MSSPTEPMSKIPGHTGEKGRCGVGGGSLRKGKVHETGGSGGKMNRENSTEKQRSDAQVVAMSSFAVISAECHVGLTDTGKKTGWEHKNSGLVYCMMQWKFDINRVFTKELVLVGGSHSLSCG